MLGTAAALLKTRTCLQLENIAFRHQLGVLQRFVKRPQLNSPDRVLLVWLSLLWRDWLSFIKTAFVPVRGAY